MGALPGGYWDAAGHLHRDVELAPLTGREEELLAGARQQTPAALVTEVLSRCVRRIGGISPVPPGVARHLLVADRQYLLLQLRRETFGDTVRAGLVCPWPDCGEQVRLDLSVAAVPVVEARDRAPVHTMELPAAELGDAAATGQAEIRFRLPDGSDQEELSGRLAAGEAEALTGLLARCILGIGPDGPPDAERTAAFTSRARSAIEERMHALAPRVEQTVDVRCTGCGRTFTAPFDVQRFFLGELRTDGDLLYREVHYLAFHYHWGEREIMGLTRDRRRRYIDVLADAIEVLNSGA